jgi:hypothetical protein
MTVTAPPLDTQGALLDAQIATVQALVTANANPAVLYQNQQLLNALQIQAVDHYMSTGWLNAGTILATYTAPVGDKTGAALLKLVTDAQTLVTNAPPADPRADGIVSPLEVYQQYLYQKQTELVDYIMTTPAGTRAATILANLTGFQSFPYDYVFSSIGFTSEALEG